MKIAIIGGGAAGLMATASALEKNPEAEIFLIERNDGLGKKVIISGGGRCNVTTGITDVKTVLTKYPRGHKFLATAMHSFPPADVYKWFELHGVPLKTQEDMRCFPVSNDGHDVVGAFEKIFVDSMVNVLLKTHVTSITKIGEQFSIIVRDEVEPLIVDKVILTTGGQAYRQTGSTGDGYAFAIQLGHSFTPLAPSLNAFFSKETWPADISGLSFKKATVTANRTGKPSFTGPFLFTHKGVSGPAVFALSSMVAFEKYDHNLPLVITIDLFPDQTHEQLRALLNKKIVGSPNREFVNVISSIIPKSLADIAVNELSLPGKRFSAEVGKKDMVAFLNWCKAVPLTIVGRGTGDEFVTAGGVNLHEVNPVTMESLITPGLFFAGEILDVDGFTGGFNLQASWATGRLAGSNSVK
jgi:predicted Rossmann fold flavoprotein